MSESELIPCDHCGCATIQEWVEGVWRNIRCAECGLGLRYLAGLDIVAAWNRRVDPNPWRYPSRAEMPDKYDDYWVIYKAAGGLLKCAKSAFTRSGWQINAPVYAWCELQSKPAPMLESENE